MAEAQPAVLTKNHTKDLQMEGAVPSDSENAWEMAAYGE
jgi:hypothetical protein